MEGLFCSGEQMLFQVELSNSAIQRTIKNIPENSVIEIHALTFGRARIVIVKNYSIYNGW